MNARLLSRRNAASEKRSIFGFGLKFRFRNIYIYNNKSRSLGVRSARDARSSRGRARDVTLLLLYHGRANHENHKIITKNHCRLFLKFLLFLVSTITMLYFYFDSTIHILYKWTFEMFTDRYYCSALYFSNTVIGHAINLYFAYTTGRKLKLSQNFYP